MGRKFAPFELVIHFTGTKSSAELQKNMDDFYIGAIKSALAESALTEPQKCEVLDRIAAYHASCAGSLT